MSDDRYSKFDYSRLVNWDERLKREWPFFEKVLRDAPSRRLLDLGSGTGEHARFLASKGFEVVGLDSSPAMLEKSRAASAGLANVRFVEGDILNLERSVSGPFGAAICVGNALPHLSGEDSLERLAGGLRKLLAPGAPFVVQMLNYDRFEKKGERALPLTFLNDPDDPSSTIVFMRTMELQPDGRVIFMPTTLRQRPDADPPIELVASQRVEIRGWRKPQIEEAFRKAGFASVDFRGSYQDAPFDPAESRDLIGLFR